MKLIKTSALLSLMILIGLPLQAYCFEPVDAELVVFQKRNQLDGINQLPGYSQPYVVSFSDIARKVLTRHIGRLFTKVRDRDTDDGSDISSYAEITTAKLNRGVRPVGLFGMESLVDIDMQVKLVITAFDNPYIKHLQISVLQKPYNKSYDDITALITKLLDENIGKAIDELTTDVQFQSAVVQTITAMKKISYDDLVAMNGAYRITDSEGVIRKKPSSKALAVKKQNMGSAITVVGRLPNGWLQVSVEGEAIGWIHEGSVTAVSAQQPDAAVAQAPVAAPGSARQPTADSAASPGNSGNAFPAKPVAVTFKRAKVNPDDIAVIIGNANYKTTAKDIPDVVPAYADAEGAKNYALQALGIKEENIIFIKDAKLKDLVATFGTDSNPKGKLYNWIKPNQSNVFIYYAGHGAPNSDGSSSYLVPTDAEASLIDLSGYSLKTLYVNLGKISAKTVTVVLEACFSGASQNGMLIKSASPIYQKAMQENVPANLTVISAGSGAQIASWEQDNSSGLFTKYFLTGMAGAADRKPYGNGDGKVSLAELEAYLKGTMSYLAQRYYGREQTAQIAIGSRQ